MVLLATVGLSGGLVLATLLLRSTYRMIAPDHAGGDAYDFFIQITDIKRAGHRRPDEPSAVVTSGVYRYPYFVLWLLSFLPTDWLESVDRHFSPTMDLLFALLLVSLAPLGLLSWPQVPLVLLLFLATPQFMRPDLSHGTGLSMRKPGLLLSTGSLLALVDWTAGGAVWTVALAAVLGGFLMMTSKFGLQAWSFAVVGVAVVTTPLALVVVPAALVVATVVSGGRYLRILEGHLLHVHDYAVEKQYKRFNHSLPNPVAWFLAFLRVDSRMETLRLVHGNRWLRPFVDAPFSVVALATYGFAVAVGADATFGLHPSFHGWVVVCVVAFVVTSLPHFLFLGQSERYLEYSFLPAVLIVARGTETLGVAFDVVVGLSVLGGLAVAAVYVWSYRNVF